MHFLLRRVGPQSRVMDPLLESRNSFRRVLTSLDKHLQLRVCVVLDGAPCFSFTAPQATRPFELQALRNRKHFKKGFFIRTLQRTRATRTDLPLYEGAQTHPEL